MLLKAQSFIRKPTGPRAFFMGTDVPRTAGTEIRRRRQAAWGLVCLLLIAGCACDEGKADRLYQTAQEHVRAGELEQAVTVLDGLLQQYPETPAAEQARREVVLYRGLAGAVRSYPVREARDQIVTTARALQRYRDRRRTWPDSLDRLVPGYLDEFPLDPWGRELLYEAKPRGRGYHLACFGADGEPGGAGDDADWFIEDGAFVLNPSRSLR